MRDSAGLGPTATAAGEKKKEVSESDGTVTGFQCGRVRATDEAKERISNWVVLVRCAQLFLS